MGEKKTELINLWNKVGQKFSKIGPDYWNVFGQRLVDKSMIKDKNIVLDVGTGRGACLIPASMKVGNNGKIIGTDISQVMVEETNKELKELNITNAEVIKVDIEEFIFPKEYFDNIIAGFSIGAILMNEKLESFLNILKKDGQLSFTLWGIQKDQQWLTNIVDEYLKPKEKQEEKIGDKKYITNINTTQGLKNILDSVNLKEIEVFEEENEVIYIDKKEWWDEMWNNACRGVLESIKNLGEDIFSEFEAKVNNELDKFKYEKGLCFNMSVIYAFGIKK